MRMRDSILHQLLEKLLPWRDITKTVNGEKIIYLRRYFIRREGKTRVFLHFFNRSDDDPDLHDHPWNFTSVILAGGYIEETFKFDEDTRWAAWQLWQAFSEGVHKHQHETVRERIRPGMIVRRQAEHAHRVILPKEGASSWSLVFAGVKQREWGFHSLEFADGKPEWQDWRKYLGLPLNTPDQPEDT